LTTFLDFILELGAVFFGVFGAFELDNWHEGRIERKECNRVLRLIGLEVQGNRDIFRIMKDTEVGGVVNIRPMRGIWDGFTSKLGLVRNDALLLEATRPYFFQSNIDRMLDIYRKYAAEYQYADSKRKAEMKVTITDERDHFVSYITNFVLPQIDTVLSLINAELTSKLPEENPIILEKKG
jgi:hypothetical protein